jgi:hypothetical protein
MDITTLLKLEEEAKQMTWGVSTEDEKVETVCRLCVFAEYGDDSDTLLQTSCEARQIQRFRAEGIQIKEYVDDDERKFFGVPGRSCLFFRNQEWKDKQPVDEDLLIIARDELTLRMDVIIYIPDGATFTDIGTTVDTLARGNIKPSRIVFCDNQNIRPSTFRDWAQGRCHKVGWIAHHIREEANFERCVDLCMKQAKGRFTAVFTAGFEVPPDFISDIDKALHDDFKRFLYLIPCDEQYNGMVIQNLVSKTFKSNRENPLAYKLEREALAQKCPEMIKEVTEIVPSLRLQ